MDKEGEGRARGIAWTESSRGRALWGSISPWDRPQPQKKKKAIVGMMRLVYEVLCVFSIAGITMMHERYGSNGLALFSLFQLAVVYLDFCISPTAGANMRRAMANGFSRSAVIAIMVFNLIGTNVLVSWVASTFCGPMYGGKLQVLWSTPGIIVCNLAMSELCFTAAHTCLHVTKYGAKLHRLHHCCKPSSWSSNLIIHPIDMAVEFSGPVLGLLLADRYMFRDPSALFLSLTVLQLWYALDHSEYLQLPHYWHHAHINNYMCIYLKSRTKKPGRDCVRDLVVN